MMSRRRLTVELLACGVMLALSACANDHKDAMPGHVRLSADREPFTFSSWDIGRVEWPYPPGGSSTAPNVAAVLTNGTVVPLRGLTLATARTMPGFTVGRPSGTGPYGSATPVNGSGFHLDFAGERLVHFVAAGYEKDGNPVQPIFENRNADDRDANGEVRQYVMPLDHDACVRLFGAANGLETDLSVPGLLP
jgi:hypothetical protein